jgi:hypothetical protein
MAGSGKAGVARQGVRDALDVLRAGGLDALDALKRTGRELDDTIWEAVVEAIESVGVAGHNAGDDVRETGAGPGWIGGGSVQIGVS